MDTVYNNIQPFLSRNCCDASIAFWTSVNRNLESSSSFLFGLIYGIFSSSCLSVTLLLPSCFVLVTSLSDLLLVLPNRNPFLRPPNFPGVVSFGFTCPVLLLVLALQISVFCGLSLFLSVSLWTALSWSGGLTYWIYNSNQVSTLVTASLGGTMAKSSANRLVGTGFVSRYHLKYIQNCNIGTKHYNGGQ